MMEPSTPCHACAAASPSDEAKVFVGGISWRTEEQSLKEYFAKYGEVASANVVRNRGTSASRGFAFVLFADSAAVNRALADTNDHVILGRKVDVKKARTRCSGHQNHQHAYANGIPNSLNGIPLNPRKIFVGGLSPSLTRVEFSSYFEQFGTIKDAVVLHDISGRSRGFGFVQFHSADAVEKVVQNRFHKLKDKMVEVKMAVPQNASNNYKEINHHSSGSNDEEIDHHSSDSSYNIWGIHHHSSDSSDNSWGIHHHSSDSSNNSWEIHHHSNDGGGGGYVSGIYQARLCPMYNLGYMSPFVPSPRGSSGFVGGCTGYHCRVGYNSLSSPAWQNLMPYSSTNLHPGYLNAGFSGYMNWPYVGYDATMGYGYSNYRNWNQNPYIMQLWNVGDSAAPQAADETAAPQAADETAAPQAADETAAHQAADETAAPQAADETAAPQAAADETAAPQAADDTAAPEAADVINGQAFESNGDSACMATC